MFDEYQNIMNEKLQRDVETAMYECRKIHENKRLTGQYTSIVVDEGQDLSPSAYYSFRAVSWSYSKGDTYDAACVILNGSTEKLVEDKFSVSTLKTVTLNKLYVALTRSKGDLYIVTQDEFETVKEKYYK